MLSVIELFAGYGSQVQALKNLNINYKSIGISEINKYALMAYEALHGEVYNFGDITKIEKLPYADLITFSFPCQDISSAGKQKGFNQNSNTRSSLLWEVERLIKNMEIKPKFLLMENVKALISKKFINNFKDWLIILNNLGYKNYWQVLNAKDYNIPQNRERVFCVSIRKDIKQSFIFPPKQTLQYCLKDFLEKSVEEKYYINNQNILNKITFLNKKDSFNFKNRFSLKQEAFINNSNSQANRVYSIDNIACNLNANSGGLGAKTGLYKIERIKLKFLVNKTIDKDYIGCIDTCNTYEIKEITNDDYRIRRLTPRESFRLMGLKDNDIDKIIKLNISDNQMYKLAGNSIVVNVLEAIFKQFNF